MKKYVIVAAALLLSAGAFAQKDELKALKKISNKDVPTAEDLKEFERLLKEVEPKMANADNEQKADYYYYKGAYGFIQMGTNPAAAMKYLDNAVADLNKVIELEKGMKKKEHTEEIQKQIFPELKAGIVTQANAMGKANNFKAAYPLYEKVYRISPTDTLYLYNAAAYAVNGQDYDKAIEYYTELRDLGFTGKSVNYTAKNSKGEVEYFGDKKIRDLYVAKNGYTEPGIFREESKRGDIIKNLALLYIQQGQTDKAKQAIAAAKKANPDDITLLTAEAQIFLEANDLENYKKAVTEILNKGSKDPNLYFNLGVTTSKSGNAAEAKQYYEKAIELKPDFVAAYQNLAILQLDGEQKVVDEMNKLGTSKKDMARYDELKKQRDDMYKKAVVYLEKANKIEPKNEDIRSLLLTMYQGLEMTDKYKALKAQQ